jgi:N-acetylglucosaminyldiphosphoundecaprenol N-acetyl-beta-D-mannosaminyltransferase
VQCPPFCATSEAEIQLQINKIKQANPDILLVALGQPKGEFWIEKHLAELGVPVSIQVGASFDFVAGIAKRAPKFLQWLGLEWFYRAINDPIRLVPRYFSNGLFLLKMLRLDAIDWLDTPTVPTRMQPKS